MTAATRTPATRVPWALTAAVTVAALAAAALGGVVLGRWAGERASEPAVEQVVIADPVLLAGEGVEGWRSAGGFTGFGGLPALSGVVQRAATVVDAAPGRVVVETEGGTTTVEFAVPARLFAIAPAEGLTSGDIVVVRSVDGVARGALIVPPDLEEGSGVSGR